MTPTEQNVKAYAAFGFADAENMRRQYEAGATLAQLAQQTNLAINVVILILQGKLLATPTPTSPTENPMNNVTRLHEVIDHLEPLGVQVTKDGTIVISPPQALFLTASDALDLADALAELAETL